jgi:hypothetical protein
MALTEAQFMRIKVFQDIEYWYKGGWLDDKLVVTTPATFI